MIFQDTELSHINSEISTPHCYEYDLLALGSEEQERISLLVKQQKGSMRVFIHPFYLFHKISDVYDDSQITISPDQIAFHAIGERIMTREECRIFNSYIHKNTNDFCQDPKFQNNELSPKLKKYFQNLVRVLRSDIHTLVLGEEKKNVESCISAMRNIGYKGDILFYKTRESSPIPIHTKLVNVALSLKDLGVSQLLIGGQYSKFELENINLVHREPRESSNIIYKYNPKKPIPSNSPKGCVGAFFLGMYESLAFKEITISATSFPFSHPIVTH